MGSFLLRTFGASAKSLEEEFKMSSSTSATILFRGRLALPLLLLFEDGSFLEVVLLEAVLVLGVATSEEACSTLTTLIAVGTLSFWGTASSLAHFPLGAINREKALSCCTVLEYRVRKNCQVM